MTGGVRTTATVQRAVYRTDDTIRYDTIRYDSVYLTCSKMLTRSQLSPPHGTNKKLKCKNKNKLMSVIGPVQSHCHEGSPVGKISLRWEGFVEKVGFEPGVKEWRMMTVVVMMIQMSRQKNERGVESRHDWRGWRNESGSWFQRRGDAYLNERSRIFNEEMVGVGEKGWQQMRSGYCEGVEQRSDC